MSPCPASGKRPTEAAGGLKAPFPFFGGKSRIAGEVWQRLGSVQNYSEPFCGSCAVLLSNPHPAPVETVNDADSWLSNFWRSVKLKPNEVAEAADYPVSEVDLVARHRWLCRQPDIAEKLKADPEWCDTKMAGIWLWGQCAWIAEGWGHSPQTEKLPHLGNPGRGINRKLPHLGNPGRGEYIRSLMDRLSHRLRDVRIACGDWSRVLGPSVTIKHGMTAVFLDPPYAETEHSVSYNGGGSVWGDVCAWCEENGDSPLLRIALCGYLETWTAPAGWTVLPWKTAGGYGSQGNGRGKSNRMRETVWFSPHCLQQEFCFA